MEKKTVARRVLEGREQRVDVLDRAEGSELAEVGGEGGGRFWVEVDVLVLHVPDNVDAFFEPLVEACAAGSLAVGKR